MLYPLKINFSYILLQDISAFIFYPCNKFIGINIINDKKNQKKLNDEIEN